MRQQRLGRRLMVDKATIGALQVDQAKAFGIAANLGVAARDFGIVQDDVVRLVSTDRHHFAAQLEPPPLVVALDDK